MTYVLGTWMWIHFLNFWAQVFYNERLHDTLYKHATQMSIVLYIFHWLFIEIGLVWIVIPMKISSFFWAEAIEWIVTFGGCYIVYALFRRIPQIGFLFGFECRMNDGKYIKSSD